MENTMLIICENLKALRKQNGFAQSSIAKYLNVDRSIISKVEKNEYSIISDMLDRLSALYGVSEESLSQESISANPVSFAFKTSEINEEDLVT